MGILTIKAIAKKGADRHTLAGSLEENKILRSPGCSFLIAPYRDIDGTFRTGLDPEALYIKQMPQEEQELEKARVSALRIDLERRSGMSLGPRDDYYTKLTDEESGTLSRAQMIKMSDNDKVFNDEDLQEALTGAWLRVHPLVAKSYEHWKRGEAGPIVEFYISNQEIENQISFDERKSINKAIVQMEEMSPSSRKRIARLMDIPVSEASTEEYVYNQLDKVLKSGEITFGADKGKRAVVVFNDLTSMKEETLNIKDLVKQALQMGIYRRVQGKIMQGELKIADSEKDFITALTLNTEDRVSLQKKVDSKKIVNQ